MNYPLSMPVKLLLANSSEYYREGFKNVLNNFCEEKYDIITEAANGCQLLYAIKANNPDVVITDINHNDPDSIEAIRKIYDYDPSIGIIALFTKDNLFSISEVFKAGARGFLLKNTQVHEIVEAINTVHSGETYSSSSTARSLCRQLITKDQKNFFQKKFSDKEKSIMKLICKELTTKEIASAMSLSIRTIEDYSKRIRGKIGCKNMVGIAIWAMRNKIVAEADTEN
jgi:DNA-binding NarL/FixJ family response regulator